MKTVTKAEFKDMYFALGKGEDGWTRDYWDRHLEVDMYADMKYLVEEPLSPEKNRIMIVTDFDAHEQRMFFLDVEEEESFFSFPG